jgi:hypothetical protein
VLRAAQMFLKKYLILFNPQFSGKIEMKIFRVSADVERFQTIMPEDDLLWESDVLRFDGKKKGNSWKAPSFFIFNPIKEYGNFFYLSTDVLVFDEKALDILGDLFEMAGEILEFELSGQPLFLLNVTECCNSLDHEKTTWSLDPQSGKRIRIKEYAFHADRFCESSIFKIPETRQAEVLTYSEVKDTADEFISRYQESSLTGLEFSLIFED